MSSIYTAPPVRAFNLDVGVDSNGQPFEISEQIDFDAAYVSVDNGGTNQYLFLPDAGSTGRYILPGQHAAVYALGSTGGMARAIWQAPRGVSQPVPSAGQQAILQFLSSGVDVAATAGISNAPQVGVVDIGSVTGNVEVINATGTKIVSSRPPLLLTSATVLGANTTTQNTGPLPADIQALVLVVSSALGTISHIKVGWHTAGVQAWVPLETYLLTQQIYAIPILPTALDLVPAIDNSLDVTWTVPGGRTGQYSLWAIFESAPLWLEFFAPPFAEPNQPPAVLGLTGAGLASLASMWLINPAPNVAIFLHEIAPMWVASAAPQWIVGHGTVLPVGVAPQASWLAVGASTTQIVFPYSGAKLPAGDGIWLQNPSGSALTTWWALFNTSLA